MADATDKPAGGSVDPDAEVAVPRAAHSLPPVQHCPFCGEHIGSFWGRRGDDESVWCEGCQAFFRVQLTP